MPISPLEYANMLARLNKTAPQTAQPFEGLEKDLHSQISEYANSRGWLVIHSRTDKASTNGVGTPDFILGAHDGVTYWIEVKKKGTKPTTEQLGKVLMLKLLGHKAAIVWSFEEFMGVVDGRPIVKPPSKTEIWKTNQ